MSGDRIVNSVIYTEQDTHIEKSAIGDHATVNFGAPTPDARHRSGLGVITVLPVETRSVREVLQLRQRDDGLLVGRGVVAVQAHGQGQGAAITAAQRLDHAFAPAVLVLAGIGGGIDDGLRLGDVVIATQVVCYDLHKQTDAGVQHRGRSWQAPIEVCQGVDRFFTERGEPAAFSGFVARTGMIGSGNAVIATERTAARSYLRNYNDKIIVVDMESDGVGQYCHRTQGLGWAVVRGISDHADPKKGDDQQASAAWNAALVLYDLIPHLER
jgi:adenosylhomocysteine nucleosidase